jgi:hypothetical protein
MFVVDGCNYYLSDFNNGIKYCSSKYIFNCTCLNVTVLKIDRNFNPVASIKYQSDWNAKKFKRNFPVFSRQGLVLESVGLSTNSPRLIRCERKFQPHMFI